ncbi:MAG: MBL fold metallo-hydrolase [Butyricicoccus sp.]
MTRTALPSVFPAEGVFESSIHVDLSCMTPNARIHYTVDGSTPTMDSPVYRREDGLIPLAGVHGTDTVHTVRAFAEADGMQPSQIATYTYRLCCRPAGTYRHALLREATAETAGLFRIEDFDLDKMYLVVGTERAVLIDAGWDETGDLVGLCHDLIGCDIPLELVVAHAHPDHIAQIPNFLNAGIPVYLPHADRSALDAFDMDISLDGIRDIGGGKVFDLGCTTLKTYAVPGHTPGGIVLLDETTGDLFASDAFGSNRRYIPDSAWLQFGDATIESSLRMLDEFLQQTEGRLTRLFTGHNDDTLDANTYLRTLRQSLARGIAEGNAALTPSLRSAAESFGSGSALIQGNWRLDPCWTSANVKYLYDSDAAAQRYAEGYRDDVHTVLGG